MKPPRSEKNGANEHRGCLGRNRNLQGPARRRLCDGYRAIPPDAPGSRNDGNAEGGLDNGRRAGPFPLNLWCLSLFSVARELQRQEIPSNA